MQRPLPDNAQHSQEPYIHAAGGIRTHNPSKWAAADPGLRPSGVCDQRSINTEKLHWEGDPNYLKKNMFDYHIVRH